MSDIIRNSAVFSSPMVFKFQFVVLHQLPDFPNVKTGAILAPALIRIEERVLPAESRNFFILPDGKMVGVAFLQSLKHHIHRRLKFRSSSRASLAFIISSSVVKFISSSGASCQI